MARNYGGRKLKSDLKKIYDIYGDNEWIWSDLKKLDIETSPQECRYLNCFIKRKNKNDPRMIYKLNPKYIENIDYITKRKLLYPSKTKY